MSADRVDRASRRRLAGLAAADDSVLERLERYVALLLQWQATHNLIGRSTEWEIWERHIADSAQLVDHCGAFETWVDIGSGAGFPGLVVAILFAGDPGRSFTLVESNMKKAAFLRAAARETGARARIVADRIEAVAAREAASFDIVSARALAPLPALLDLAAPLLKPRGRMLLLKGRDFGQEEEQASHTWRYDLLVSPSAADSSGCVAVVSRPEPKQ